MTCTTNLTWQTCADLPTLVFKDESSCSLDFQYQPFDAKCKVFCRHQLTCLCARAHTPRDSDRDAHVVCPGKILTPAECHAFTLASSTARSFATMRWAQRCALPGGLAVVVQSTRQSNELASKGPHLTRLSVQAGRTAPLTPKPIQHAAGRALGAAYVPCGD